NRPSCLISEFTPATSSAVRGWGAFSFLVDCIEVYMGKQKLTWRHILRKILSLLFSRLVVTAVLLLLRHVGLVILFYRLSDYAAWLNGAGLVLSVIMCLGLIRQDSTVPEFKISWLILFTVMPVQGGLLCLLWGDKRPAIRLRRRMEQAEAQLAPL